MISPASKRHSGRTPGAAAVLLACAVSLVLGLTLGGSAAAEPIAKSSKGGGGIYWGAQIGSQLTGEEAPWDMGAAHKFEGLVGKKMSLLSFSTPFARCQGSDCEFFYFPTTPMEDLREAGIIPVLGWSSSSVSEGTKDPRMRLGKIIHGTYDSYIRDFARGAAEWGHPFFLRFDWEMNGNWFPWSEGVNGNKRGQFVAAWRHIHDIFTSAGATNATWVWCPNVGYEEKMRGLYPGNKYVDWTCLDGYNWGTRFSWSHWQSFRSVFNEAYRKVTKIAPRKPVMLGEVASSDIGGSKTNWIKEMLSLLPSRYKKVHGLVWFDVNDRGTHWPIETSRQVTKAFSRGIRRGSYKANLYAGLAGSPIKPPR